MANLEQSRPLTELYRKQNPSETEKEKPFTFTLSNKEQEVMLNSIKSVLKRDGIFRDRSENAALLRNIATGLIKNMGIQIEPEEALFMGLTEFIPREKLQEWSDINNFPRRWNKIIRKNLEINQRAQYYLRLEKEARKQ